jgi:hypothetical protein
MAIICWNVIYELRIRLGWSAHQVRLPLAFFQKVRLCLTTEMKPLCPQCLCGEISLFFQNRRGSDPGTASSFQAQRSLSSNFSVIFASLVPAGFCGDPAEAGQACGKYVMIFSKRSRPYRECNLIFAPLIESVHASGHTTINDE